MKKNFSILILFFILSVTQTQASTYDFPTLINRIQTELWNEADGSGATWIEEQNANGSWSDLQYGTSSKATTAKNHLVRLYEIAQSCTDSRNSKYNNIDYVSALKKGLDYWYLNRSIDTNWWYNQIYYPQRLGEIMLLMRKLEDPLPIYSETSICEEELLTLFSPVGKTNILSHSTGANAVDIALHYLYRGLLTQDTSVLESIAEVLEPTLLENITADLTYQDHGPQLQISSYGYVFCDALFHQAYYLSGSPAAFDTENENFATLLEFVKKVQIPAIRGSYWDISAVGRGISRPNNTGGSLSYLKLLASAVDTINADFYNDALLRHNKSKPANYNVEEFNRHYWESDYTQHSRKEYLFTVRNVSSRTAESETGNNENLKANYFSYGATFIAVDGDEYYNIMPVWDWSMIPGITMKNTSDFPSRSTWGNNYGNTSFVGGVSDGTYGNSVLTMNKDGVQANKSWFFFDDEIVCLGAGISGTEVLTTVNQCLFEGASSYLTKGATSPLSKSVSSTENNPSDLQWIRHGKIAYYFSDNQDVKFTMKSQSGSWYDINNTYSKTELSEYVFKLWIDHGTTSAGQYAYTVVPNTTTDNEAQNYNSAKVQILQNDEKIQAVYHTELNILQAVFYEAGSLSFNNKTISVNQPSTLLFNGTEVSIADPKQLVSAILVKVEQAGTTYQKIISLPTGEYKGQSISADLEIPASLSDAPALAVFNIYPNPAKDILNLELSNGHYQIVNLQGIELMRGECYDSAQINIKHLSKGHYIIQIEDEMNNHSALSFLKN